MKTKLLLLVLLVAGLISNEAMAFKIIIDHPGRDGKVGYVEITGRHIICRGPGSIICPVGWQVSSNANSRLAFNAGELQEEVDKYVAEGIYDGTLVLNEELKAEWVSKEKGYMELEVDIDPFKYIDNYKELMEKYPSTEKK